MIETNERLMELEQILHLLADDLDTIKEISIVTKQWDGESKVYFIGSDEFLALAGAILTREFNIITGSYEYE